MRCHMLVQKPKYVQKCYNTHNMRTVSCIGLHPIIIVHSARNDYSLMHNRNIRTYTE